MSEHPPPDSVGPDTARPQGPPADDADDVPTERRSSIPAHSAATVSVIEALLRRRSWKPSFAARADSDAARPPLDALVPSIPPQPRVPREVQAPATGEAAVPAVSAAAPAPSPAPEPVVAPALQAIPRRLPAGGGPAHLQRAELLQHLAEGCDGVRQAELLCAAAELAEHAGAHAEAVVAYERAHAADPADLMALRALRRHAQQAGDLGRAAALIDAELSQPLSAREAALTHTLRAELTRSVQGDAEAATQAALRAVQAHPQALPAWLMLGQLAGQAGDQGAAAEAYRRAAEMWPDDTCRAALLLEAGRALLLRGDAQQALSLLSRAAEATPDALPVQLELHRAAMAADDVDAALSALQRAQTLCPAGAAQDTLRRLRARLLLERKGDAGAAQSVLDGVGGSVNLRLRARAAELTGDVVGRRRALEGWASAAGGTERALACLELSQLSSEVGAPGEARAQVEAALEADPGLGLCQLLGEWLAREAGEAPPEAPGTGDDAEGVLAAAARLAGVSGADEHACLRRAVTGAQPELTALELTLDAAIGGGLLPETRELLSLRAARQAAVRRIGPKLALLDLTSRSDVEGSQRRLSDAAQVAEDQPAVLSEQRFAAHSASALSTAWRRIAEAAHAEHAAFAWAMSGHALAQAGQYAAEPYQRADSASRGFAPAAWARAHLAVERGDAAALREEQRLLAETAAGAGERAARWVRVATLTAADAAAHAALLRAADDAPDDIVLMQRAIARSPVDAAGSGQRAEYLREMAARCSAAANDGASGGQTATALRLRAAAELEAGGQIGAAIDAYREILQLGEAGAAFAAHGLQCCLRACGDTEALLPRLADAVDGAGSPVHALPARIDLAEALEEQGRDAEALAQWCQVSALLPQDLEALRARQRIAIRSGDGEQALRASRALSAVVSNPVDRTPFLRQVARALSAADEVAAHDAWLRDSVPLSDPDDIWFAVALWGAALRVDEPALVATALGRAAGLVGDPLQRASLALGASLALEPGSPQRAVEVLAPAVQAAPGHPVAAEELARLARVAGDLGLSARAFATAAAAAPGQTRALRLWYSAACLWQDELHDLGASRLPLQEAARRDLHYQQTFERLRRALESAGDQSALCALLQRRIATEERAPASLYLELADLQAARAEPGLAREALERCVEAYPGHLGARQRLADAHAAAGDWASAAEQLVAVARLAQEPALLRETFLRLGEIYTGPLPDLRRAEIAYGRCLGNEPDDRDAISALIEVFVRSEQPERAVRAAQRLRELASGDGALEAATVRLAEVLVAVGHAELAERELNHYFEKHPTSLAVADALADRYEAEGDAQALGILMHRAFHALRAALSEQPAAVDHLRALHMLALRHLGQAAAGAVLDVARALGLPPRALGADELPLPFRAEDAVQCGQALRLLVAKPLGPATLRFFQAAAPVFEQVLPASIGAVQAQTRPPPALTAAAGRVRHLFGLEALELQVTAGVGCGVRTREPLCIGMGQDTLHGADTEVLCALLLGCAAQARAGLHVLTHGTEAQLSAVLHALCRLLDPSHLVPEAEAEAVDAVLPRVSAALDGADRATIERALHEMAYEFGTFDAAALRQAARAHGQRASLVLSGDCGAALGGLLRAEGAGTLQGTASVRGALAAHSAAARELLGYALSEARFEVIAAMQVASAAGGGEGSR